MTLITEAQRRVIAGRAAALQEVLENQPSKLSLSATPSAEATGLSAWNQAYSPGDSEAFTRRLNWDRLDWDGALRALSQEPSSLFEKLPQWTRWLEHFAEEATAFAEEQMTNAALPEAGYFEEEVQPPFLELSVPILRAAVNRLGQTHVGTLETLSRPARYSMERQLLRETTAIWELALYELFVYDRDRSSAEEPPWAESPNSNVRYQAFVSRMLTEGLGSVFETYPVLARLLARLVETWVETSGEFLDRFRKDRHTIANMFHSGEDPGKITWVETGLSDRHNGGRRVILLELESGLRLVYKPRDVGLEQAYNSFLSWCNKRYSAPSPKTLKILAHDDYGWVECVAQEDPQHKDAAREYYRKSGGLICLAHLLRGQDLHMENLIGTKDGPVLIDTEMLMQPVAARGELGLETEPRTKWDAKKLSCVETGLLSLLQTDPEGQSFDIGGLRGRGGFLSPVKKRLWIDSGRDAMRFVEEDDFGNSQKNQVRLNGSVQVPDQYAVDVIEGFSGMYRFLLTHQDEILSSDGPLRWFEEKRTRVVFRTTQQYALLQHLLASPKYQRDGRRRSFVMEALNRLFRHETDRPRLWPLVTDERNALDDLDIPRFTIDTATTSLESESGERVEGIFTRSGLSAVKDIVGSLSESQLETQKDLLQEALINSLDARFQIPLIPHERTHEDQPAELNETFQEYAIWIGRELMGHYFGGRSEKPKWTIPAQLRRREAQEPLAPLSLYEGIAGIGLFMAALATVTNGVIWRHAAMSTVEPLKHLLEHSDGKEILQTAPVGACDGIGSIVYSLSWMSRLLETPSLAELAVGYARTISQKQIDADVRLDVAGGAAGAILGLLALHHLVRESSILELAERCGNHLLAHQVSTSLGGIAWPAERKHLLAGFAHGAAGIAYALTRLFRLTENRELLDAAKGAHLYERSLFSTAHANWPIVQGAGDRSSGSGSFMTAWCHGAPGVGLARVLSLDVLCDDSILGEIETAIHTTAHLERNRSDHICCGNLGRSEMILTTGLHMERPDLVDAAKAIAVQVTSLAREQQRFFLPTTPFQYSVFTPGFFRGLSGIGYQLLRAAAPQRLPSVLSFEPDLPTTPMGQRGQP